MTDDQRELLLKAQQRLEAAKLLLTNNYPDYAASALIKRCSTSQKPF